MAPWGNPAALWAVNRLLMCTGVLAADRSRGALSSLWAGAGAGFAWADSGAYVVPYARTGTPGPRARDPALADGLWAWTEREMNRRGLLLPDEGR